jgi:3-hexulose-6-phosphate synthase
MKMHIAFNTSSLDHAISVARLVVNYVDVIEVGTSLLYKYGIAGVTQLKAELPKTPLLIDSKIIYRSRIIVPILAEAKPQWITVMAGAHNSTIHATCVAAHSFGINVMMNLLDARSVGQSAMEAKNLGVDALLFHQSNEKEESLSLLEQWDMVRGNTNIPIFIAAKITRQNLQEIIAVSPDGIILGDTVVEAENPQEEAKFFYTLSHSI